MTSDLQLTLRPTVIGGVRDKDDYCVFFDGRSVGRIKLASEREGHTPGWDWHINPPLPVPSWCDGTEDDLEVPGGLGALLCVADARGYRALASHSGRAPMTAGDELS
jgi:hypothetical protein